MRIPERLPTLPASAVASSASIRFGALLLAALLWRGSAFATPDAAPSAAPAPPGGVDPFDAGQVHDLALTIDSFNLDRLRSSPRAFTRATLRSGPHLWPEVALHLKGATGSFRPIDDKPSFTIDFSRFDPNSRFHGLKRIYLNNSVEDPAYLHELLGSQLFRLANIPAPRVAHARVQLNGRRLGLYVLKEGFTEEFLEAHFRRSDGNLYDNDWGHDIDQPLHRNLGPGPSADQKDLEKVAAAARSPDPAQRWQQLESCLDVTRFIDFMALEVMLGHRDGYCIAHNNFRIYSDPKTQRVTFLPDGMDQLLGLPDFPWRPRMSGLVAAAILDTPEGQRAYAERFATLLADLLHVDTLTRQIDHLERRLRPGLPRAESRTLAHACADLKRRLAQRHASLTRQISQPPIAPLVFTANSAHPTNWFPVDIPPGGRMDRVSSPDGVPSLHIIAGPKTSASWRCRVRLEPGRYRFEARAKVARVRPLPSNRFPGAGLRIAGGARSGAGLVGTTNWQTLAIEFDTDSANPAPQLLCELQASNGELWVDIASITITRIPPQP